MNVFEAIADFVERTTSWVLSWFGDDPRVEQIRQKVAVTCHFLPTVASVSAMLNAANPAVTGVLGIASAICQAVNASRRVTSLSGDEKPVGEVNGVPIEGSDLKG
jgi:hypothetical protein